MNLDIYLYISWGLTTIVYYALLHETPLKWTSNEKQVVSQQLRKIFLQISSKTSKYFACKEFPSQPREVYNEFLIVSLKHFER